MLVVATGAEIARSPLLTKILTSVRYIKTLS